MSLYKTSFADYAIISCICKLIPLEYNLIDFRMDEEQ